MSYRDESDDVQPLDPIAMTLAVWLGLIVAVTGLIRMSEHAAARAALNQASPRLIEENQMLEPRIIALGD